MNNTCDQDDNNNDEPSNTDNDLEGSDIDSKSDVEDVENNSDVDKVDNNSNSNNDVGNKASKYLKKLIRYYLRTIVEDFQALEPPTVQQINNSTVREFIQIIIARLKQDHDIMLAYLLRAAVDVGKTATIERLKAINRFL